LQEVLAEFYNTSTPISYLNCKPYIFCQLFSSTGWLWPKCGQSHPEKCTGVWAHHTVTCHERRLGV